MSASQPNPERDLLPQNWWLPSKGAGLWKVQVTPERPDFGLCVNTLSGEQKAWPELKVELYGESWTELVREALESGRAMHEIHGCLVDNS